MTRYTENLLQKGKERKRLTDQLQHLVGKLENEIASATEAGTVVYVHGHKLEVNYIASNVGGDNYITKHDREDDEIVFVPSKEPGTYFNLHGDFSCRLKNAPKEDWLWFANNAADIIAAFEAEEQKIIEALREGFEKLKNMADV